MSETSKIRSRLLEIIRKEKISYLLTVDLGGADDPLYNCSINVDRRALPGVHLAYDVRELPFCDSSMPVIYSSHTLEDLQDTEGALREWWRVLKTNGFLILYLPDKRWYPNIGHPLANKAHKHDWTREEFMEGLNTWLAGEHFEVVVSEDRPPPDGVYVYEKRGEMEYSFLVVLRKD